MISPKFYLSAAILLLALNVQSYAQSPTTVVVRALAKDAKFIGSSMGGAMILIRNAETGELLAKGLTEGSTGDTKRLVEDSHSRYGNLSTDGAAKFEATLQLDKPVFVTIQATAPQAQRQSRIITSTQLWLIPGKDITGDGLILEIPGFVVDVLEPRAHVAVNSKEVEINANVVMMCGCPTSEGGLWDSSEFEVKALTSQNGKKIEEMPLKYTGETSFFSGSWNPKKPGAYEITVYVFDPRTGNSGVDKSTVTVK